MTRPLPEVTIGNEFFWTAGSDDVLRIQECGDCAALIHPPQPVCRYCRGRNMGVRDVSGKATLSAFTVNHRFGFPDLPPPYVVAQVAIVEDPRVRLTTNIIDCDPDELTLGQTVEVTFEKLTDEAGAVWLPLFRPSADGTTGPQATDEIAPQDFGKYVRPPLTTKKFEEHSAITGIGASRLGRRQMVPPLSLTVDACQAAVADAGLTFEDIDGLSTYPGLDIAGIGEGGVSALEGALGLRPTWINGGMDTFGPGGSVVAAMMAIATGMARHVLCFRTLWEATFQQLMKEGKMSPPGGRRSSGYQMPFGATSAAHTLALNAQRHFDRYGTTRETLGWIALNQRANAALNPTAIYRDPMTMDDYLNARMITTPFGLYDCDVPCDGAIAVVVSAIDAAKDMPRKPVLFEAVGTQIIERTDWDQT
ncbi:MAG: OB-fold domain-containing protein, partial [Mycobacteriaceae bacterium]|nr:OB-fold domain-containing protein [Mycobacteriaceae bacterium]